MSAGAQFDPDRFMASRQPTPASFDPDAFMKDRGAPPTIEDIVSGRDQSKHLDTSGGGDTFRQNMATATSGTIGDRLGMLAHVLGTPVEGLIHVPAAVMDWFSRGGHNPPSGGFLSEEPITQGYGDAVAAILPGSGEQAWRGTKSAAAGVAAGVGDINLLHPFSLKPFSAAGRAFLDYWKSHPPEQVPGPGMAYPDLSQRPQPLWKRIAAAGGTSPAEFQPIPQTQLPSGRIPGSPRSGLTVDISAAPKPAPPELLDGLAQSLAGKTFSKLAADDQAAVQQIADRISNAPANGNAAQAPPAPARSVPPAPANGTAAQPSVAQQLFNEMQASGQIPAEAKPGEPFGGKPQESTENFEQAARTKRGSAAESFAGTFHEHGIGATDLPNVQVKDWQAIAQAQGIEWPTTKVAQAKLIRDTTNQLREMEGGK